VVGNERRVTEYGEAGERFAGVGEDELRGELEEGESDEGAGADFGGGEFEGGMVDDEIGVEDEVEVDGARGGMVEGTDSPESGFEGTEDIELKIGGGEVGADEPDAIEEHLFRPCSAEATRGYAGLALLR